MKRIVIVTIAIALLVVARTGGRGIASRAFPGDGAYLTAPPSPVYNNLRALTVSAWIKPTGFGSKSYATVMVKSPVNFIFCPALLYNPPDAAPYRANSFEFNLFNQREAQQATSDSIANTIPLGGWIHIASTFSYVNGGQPLLYINGAPAPIDPSDSQLFLQPGAPNPNDANGGWFIGDDAFGNSFIGEMADIRIFNTVLSQAQIEAITFGGQPASANLVAWWKLDASAPYFDSSGHGNNLTEGNSFGIGSTSPGTDAPPIARWSGL